MSGRLTPSFRPLQVGKRPPCQAACPASGDIRAWVGAVAQRRKTGLPREEAYARAWQTIAAVNPFPAVLGRVCPHPCEAECNRTGLDEPVSVNAMERFLGDWALANALPLPTLVGATQPESIGVVGAGPSGLSFACQMARRGYLVTVYEARARAGGMLRYGIPDYRLPPAILDAEIQRILDLGVELRLQCAVGRDVPLVELRERHDALYVGIGAQRSRALGLPGGDGDAVWSGTDFLARVNGGEQVEVRGSVAVIGGGNTAVDAARTARRAGADAVILYRRSPKEMPAIAEEVEQALEEGVRIEFLVAPLALGQDDGMRPSLTVQRMSLGEPDGSGRRSPVPISGSEFELTCDMLIAAVSQEPDWDGLEQVNRDGWLVTDEAGAVADDLWAGGDVIAPGLVVSAVGQGRRAAEALHARLRGLPELAADARRIAEQGEILFDIHPTAARADPSRLPPAARLLRPDAEISRTIGDEQFLSEAARCLSCGACFGCEQCSMYCTPLCFSKLGEVAPGAYFSLSLDACEECGKCVDVCPSGFLEVLA